MLLSNNKVHVLYLSHKTTISYCFYHRTRVLSQILQTFLKKFHFPFVFVLEHGYLAKFYRHFSNIFTVPLFLSQNRGTQPNFTDISQQFTFSLCFCPRTRVLSQILQTFLKHFHFPFVFVLEHGYLAQFYRHFSKIYIFTLFLSQNTGTYSNFRAMSHH